MMKITFLTLYLIFSSMSIFGLEIDQFTYRDIYTPLLGDFTAELNFETNRLIKKAIDVYNSKWASRDIGRVQARKYLAFEIYKITAGKDDETIDFRPPNEFNAWYALVYKSGRGRLQSWIIEQDDNPNVFHLKNNVFSYMYPSFFNHNYIFKIRDIQFGSDKIDHFFDQGYSYFLKSNYGEDDTAALDFGISSEHSWFGTKFSGIFSFADIKANWKGYQFFKNIFSREYPYFSLNNDGTIMLEREFNWVEHVDWEFDELRNPSVYRFDVKNVILISIKIKKNRLNYCTTFEYLKEKGMFDWVDRRSRDYMNGNVPSVEENLFYINEICQERSENK